ncbi:DNA polymerase theta isoform X1 [Diorhabda carinulata]|uniref:DNA polymerase theta isoform X1 n=2 Tax=Diorhabda carinulata TaxID=1163345 RepID=UPI0025A29CA4|nr:DNA polymerase theta isoform X1 [Diorhabda carinulata]
MSDTMNNDLFMNDTFENFNFTQNSNFSAKFTDISPKVSVSKESSKQNKNETEILLDDSIFLSQLSLLEEKNVSNNVTEQQTKNNNGILEKNVTASHQIHCDKENVVNKTHNDITPTVADYIPNNPNSHQLNELASWGLPEAVLEKYKSRNLTTMFQWQVECLSQGNILNGSNLIYSAPTSAGKTLVAEILAAKMIFEQKKRVIFILPFVSIVREKMYYFQDLFESSGIRVDGFMGSYNPPGGYNSVQFAICTIEKANSLINRLLEERKLKEVGAVLIDEIHLLGDSSRGYLLELLLTKLRYISIKENLSIQIIGMSATLPNLKQISKWLDAELFTTDFRPVPLKEQAHVCGEIYDINMKLIRSLSILPELKTDCDNILQLCLETIKESCSVLIFCPTKNWCENLAQQIATGFFKIGSSQSDWGQLLRHQLDTNLIMELLEQLKYCPVGLDDILHKTVSFGVAFHHAGLTMDERDIIEGAFRNGALRVLVATSTLSSGVNLPARRVIIRTPIFHGKPIDSLVYRQMIGRAGRMGKDTMGESFLICQKKDFKIVKDLMSAVLPPVKSCLESEGKLKRAILEVIASGVATTPEDVKIFTESTLLAVEDDCLHELNNPIEEAVMFLQMNEFIRLQEKEDGSQLYVSTSLGKACLSSSMSPDDGLSLFTELEKARQCLVLETELHLIYLVTPYSACYSWGNMDWMLYLDLWEKLPTNMKQVGKLVGIRESYIVNATRGIIQTNTAKLYHKLLVHKRFFIALALQDLVNEKPLSWVCQKFNCNRGMLQSLQQSSSSFAGMVTAFSKQLGWSNMELLISQFQERMQFGVSRDLLDLMHLPVLNGKMARALYNSGIETIIQLANSEISSIENILHRIVPFESEKEREGETEYDKRQRNKYKNVWIVGKEGLTEREAAEIFVKDARKYLKIEMGLVDAQWKDKEVKSEIEDENKTDKNETNVKNVDNDNEIDKRNSESFFSEDSSVFSSISDTSSISSIDSTKIDENNEERITKKLERFTIDSPKKIINTISEENYIKSIAVDSPRKCLQMTFKNSSFNPLVSSKLNINTVLEGSPSKLSDITTTIANRSTDNTVTPKSDITSTVSDVKTESSSKDAENDVNALLQQISLSDFSETLSENNHTNLIESRTLQNNDKVESDQSLFEESFTLYLSENNSDEEKLFNGNVNGKDVKEDEHGTIIENEKFLKDNEKETCLLSQKRKHSSGEFGVVSKKIKFKCQENDDDDYIDNSYIINKLEDQLSADFSRMEIVNVCQEFSVLEIFIAEFKLQKFFSFSVACSKMVENKPVIGINAFKTQLATTEGAKHIFQADGRKLEGFSICWENNIVYYLSFENIKIHQKIIKLLKSIFGNPDVRVKMFDAKEQIKFLKKCCGINFFCKIDDPKIAHWMLDPDGKEMNLKAMAVKYCPESAELAQLSGGCIGLGSVGMDIYSSVSAKIRASLESVITWHLINILKNILLEENSKYIEAYDIETSIIVCLANIELYGMHVDKTVLTTLLNVIKTQKNNIEKKAFSLAGRKFNFVSSSDVAKIIGTFRGRKTSTKKQILEKNQHPVSDLVLQWRKLHSIITKTIYPLIKVIKNDRIYGCYITHSSTGRISMHEPNLQNITRNFDVNNCLTNESVSINCREAFDAPDKYILLSADYCQLELRILTHFSQDKLLCKIMKEPGDVFKSIAAKWNRITEEEVTDAIRQDTKHLCYGIIYGMGCRSLAEQLGINENEAVDFMETFKNTYPGIKNFIKNVVEKCKENEFVETVNGRRRYLPKINDKDQISKGQAERQAVNTIIQGSAADIVKKAMLKIDLDLREVFHKAKSKPNLVLHLHDELIYEVPTKYLRKVAKIVKKNMETCVDLSVPFPVKLKSGFCWGNLTELVI